VTVDLLWSPFAEFAFMRRALLGGVALACSAAPLGVFLILRRMSLIGDAIAHGILPGAALAFWLFGLSLPALTLGGLAAGLGMAGAAAWVSRRTGLREDASLAALYPISLASGVLLLGLAGRKLDLLHLLFGSALAVDADTLSGMLATAAFSLLVLALIYRALALDSLDPLVPAQRQPNRAIRPCGLPDSGGAQPGDRLPGNRCADGGGADDAAGCGCAFLEPTPARPVAAGCAAGRPVCMAGAAAVVLRQPAQRAVHRPAGGCVLPDFSRCGPGIWPAAFARFNPDRLRYQPMRHLFLLLALWLPLSLQAAEKISVVTSFSILADMTREVGGEHIELTNLVGPDADAHLYEPSPDDAQALLRADLIIANGLGFEPWLERLMASSEPKGKRIDASAGVVPLMLEEEGEAVPDPHAWQGLTNAEIYVRNIAKALVALDPAHRNDYERRRDAYLSRLHALLKKADTRIGSLPASQRKVVTSHDAFGYLGQAWQLRFIAPQGLSTHDEPSAADVAALIRQLRQEGVRAVFVENIRDPRLIEQIAEEAGATVGGTLYSDALASAGPASTYLGMFEHNLDTLMQALQP